MLTPGISPKVILRKKLNAELASSQPRHVVHKVNSIQYYSRLFVVQIIENASFMYLILCDHENSFLCLDEKEREGTGKRTERFLM